MGKNSFTDKQLKEALIHVQDSMLDAIPDELPEHEFSGDFQKKIEKLSQQNKSVQFRRKWITRAAAAVVAVLLGTSLFFNYDVEAQASVLAWIKEEFERYNIFWFTDRNSETLPECKIQWVPNDMDCIVDDQANGRTFVYAEKSTSKGFTLHYAQMNQGTGTMVDFLEDQYNMNTVEINGCHGELYINRDRSKNNMLVWFDEKNDIAFDMTSNLDGEVMLHIAKNVVLTN